MDDGGTTALRRIDAFALTLRARAFQPLADLLIVRARTNCFQTAAWLLLASGALRVAEEVHDIVDGRWFTPSIAIDLLWVASLGWVARHLVRFQRTANRNVFRIVHPVFHGCVTTSCMTLLCFGFTTSMGVTSCLFAWRGLSEYAWTVCRCSELLPMALGLMMASCEWRKLPPANTRAVPLPKGVAASST